MENDLKKQAYNGALWSLVERFASAGMNFIIGLVLARLLMPHEYGLIAMLSIFIIISQSIIDSGFSNALVRKKNRTEKDNSTAFYFNIVTSVVIYLALFMAAPFIADFYNESQLIHVTRVLGLSLVIGSLAIVQQTVLTSQIDFKTQSTISVSSAAVSGVVGILLAYYGYGVWALVAQNLSANIMRTIFLWVCVRWVPRTGFDKESFRYLFGYGSKLVLSGLLETIYRNLYAIVIGKTFSATSLGFYSRGEQLGYFPANNITAVVQRVTFPVLSKIQDEEERVRSVFLKVLDSIVYILFPCMILLIVTCEPIVRIILTEKWIDCVPIIQILSISFMWLPVHILNINLLQVKGQSGLVLRIEIIKKIIGVSVLFASIPFGIIAMCWGRVLYCFLELFVNLYYPHKLYGINILQQMKIAIGTLLNFSVAGSIVYTLSLRISNDYVKILIGVLLLGAYWIGWTVLSNRFEIRKRLQGAFIFK